MATAQAPTRTGTDLQEIKIVSHSNLFYWWPVWAVGFLMGILTFVDDHRMVILPAHSVVYRDKDGNIIAAAPNKDAMVIQEATGELTRTDPKTEATTTQPITT